MNSNPRIKPSDTVADVFEKMSEGNPGALNVCALITSKGQGIDPDAFMGGVGTLLYLDTLRIYGSRIEMLYKDVCGEDLISTLGILRASQFGFISDARLDHAIDNRGDGLDVEDVLRQVKERLPEFGKIESEEDDAEEQGGI